MTTDFNQNLPIHEELEHPLAQFHFCPKCGSSEFVVANKKAKHCNSCGFTYYFNPSAATACFITDRMHNVLVTVRASDPAKGTYDLPGGFIDNYENAEQGVAREVMEETSIDANSGIRGGITSPLKNLFSLPNIYPYSGFNVHTVDLFFHLGVESLEPFVGRTNDDSEITTLLAIPLSKLKPEDFGLESIRKAVEMVLRERYF